MRSNIYLITVISLISFSIMMIITVSVHLIDGSFNYGDAYNFISYRRNILAGADLFDLGTINVYVVSLIYSDNPVYNLFINVILYLTTISFILRKTARIDGVSLLVLFLLLCSVSTFTRMIEPSREYILHLTLFLAALHGQKKDRLAFIFLLLLVVSIRPVYVAALPFIIVRTSYAIVITAVIYIVFSQFDLEMFRFITGRINDYEGDYSNNILLTTALNFLGGVNGWMTDTYPIKDRLIILFSYIQRIAALALIICFKRWATLNVVLFAISLAAILQFPHPRYLEPVIFFFLGKIFIERQHASSTK